MLENDAETTAALQFIKRDYEELRALVYNEIERLDRMHQKAIDANSGTSVENYLRADKAYFIDLLNRVKHHYLFHESTSE